MKRLVLALIFALQPALALAGLTEQQIGQISLSPPPDAQVPTTLVFKNLRGQPVTLGDTIAGRPTLLLPADFTCKQICGPALSIAASALAQTGLQAGRDYSVVVLGINLRDSLDDARRFTAGQIGGPGVSVLSGDETSIQSLTTAMGYHFTRDAPNDAIAHPAAFVTLTSDGHVSRVLSSLALRPTDLRLALIEAGGGKVGGLTGRIALLCYGFDAVHGIYTWQIVTLLRIAGGLTVAVLVATLGLMLWRTGKRGASA
jgi:protein SCO1/2